MCAARLVMMQWAEEYYDLMMNSGVEPELLEVYVDDGRQAGAAFRLGTRFDPASKKFIITEAARREDQDPNEKDQCKDGKNLSTCNEHSERCKSW